MSDGILTFSANRKQNKVAPPHRSCSNSSTSSLRYPLHEASAMSNASPRFDNGAMDEEPRHWEFLGMDCDQDEGDDSRQYRSLEEVVAQTKARMPANARMGLPASYSAASIASSAVSAGSFDTNCEDDFDLSRSMESEKSYFASSPVRSQGSQPSSSRRGSALSEAPRSPSFSSSIRGSLGQALGLSTKQQRGPAAYPGSPLAVRADLPRIAENHQVSPRSLSKTTSSSNLVARRKLPQLAIHNAPMVRDINMPHTPGGSIFCGARDGAATSDSGPVSPFIPPTPLVAPKSFGSYVDPAAPRKQGSLPLSQSRCGPVSMQRQGSLGLMSPLSKEFAALGVQQPEATSTEASGSQSSLNSLDSSWSASTAITPPVSPLALASSKPSSGSSSRQSSAESTSSVEHAKKRSKDGYDSQSLLGAARPKLMKSKSATRVSPYPASKESALLASPSRTKVEPASAVPIFLKAPAMEKSISAPPAPKPKTVSAQILADRSLHPGFVANYTIEDELGSGGFGFVVAAHRNRDGMPVAVKFIWKDKVPRHGWVQDPSLGVIPLEAFVLRVVDHPAVVRFIELFEDRAFFYLVMEMHGSPWKAPESVSEAAPVPQPQSPSVAVYAPDSSRPTEAVIAASSLCESPRSTTSDLPAVGAKPAQLSVPARPPMERRTSRDLFECIEQHSRLPEHIAAWVFAQIVEAVFYLNSLGITHRDIKDENCVIDSDWNVKLIDFGSAVISDPRKPAPYFDRFFGTMTFASSEILCGKQYRAPQAEVWSLGVLLSILLTGEVPFSEPAAAKEGRISRKIKSTWSEDAYDLLQGCVQEDANMRATIGQIRDHPWVMRAWERKGIRRPEVHFPQF